MTREERELSITYLEEMKENYIEGEGYERHPLPEYYAIEYAIEALSAEPCEDAVSRQEVLEAQAKYAEYVGATKFWQMRDDIKSLPSVTPTRKKGKWTDGNPICPCCGEDKFKDLDADIWADWKPKFCPNCGAEMESGIRNESVEESEGDSSKDDMQL